MICGIYMIENTVDGKCYIGQSVDIKQRWRDHKHQLNNNLTHANRHLQRAWNKYGGEVFSFKILLECPKEELTQQEQFECDKRDRKTLYNLRECVDSNRGFKHSDETKAKLGGGTRGKPRPPEVKAKISAANKGKVGLKGRIFSPETRAKISAASKGKQKSMEHRAKLSAAAKLDWKKRKAA